MTEAVVPPVDPTVSTAEAAPAPIASLSEAWVTYITPFALGIGKSVDDVTVALKNLVGEPGDEAIGLLQDAGFTPNDDIVAAIGTGVPTAKLKKAIAGLRAAPAPMAADPTVQPMGTATFDVLPTVPSDTDWLAALKVGGVLKFNPTTVIGAVSAALASRVGLYNLPDKIAKAMETQAESLEEPVGQDYYDMMTMLTQRSYAEIFAAMPGVSGRFATQKRKDELLRRVDDRLWKSLSSYQQQLKQWIEAWQQASMNPSAMAAGLSNLVSSMTGGGAMVPSLTMGPPPTDGLRDAADGVVNDINYVFAGTGIPVALALAYDAQQIRAVLENPSLPMQVGAANREQMLRQLGAAVSSDYPRLERNLKQFALGIIELQNVTAGQTELLYIQALYQLGMQIPWDKLGESAAAPGLSGIGRRSSGSL